MEQNLIESFEKTIAEIISAGAENREQAISWLRSQCPYHEADIGFMEYEYGLPRDYLKR